MTDRQASDLSPPAAARDDGAAGAVSRRAFVAAAAGAVALGTAALGAPALLGLARKAGRPLAGGFADDGHGAGHALRDGAAAPAAREVRRTRVVVVGGGAAGLSAAWWLRRRGLTAGADDFAVLELAAEPGGNARGGANAVSAYPWGAHYVPVPGPRAEHLRLLFGEMGVLRPDGAWNERDLVYAPAERTFVHGRWREGLEEAVAAGPEDRRALARLAERVAELRATGAFTVPLALGAPAAHPLDALTAEAWLAREGLAAPAARWLVDYACRDDFGTRARDASAWAALHYFAARDGSVPGDDDAGPLTWPEGNARIVRHLAARAAGHVVAGAPVRRVEPAGPGAGAPLRVLAGAVEWRCDAVVWAAPTFLAPYVVAGAPPVPWDYAPWLVANVTLDRRPLGAGGAEGGAADDGDAPEAWDNVIAASPALGYVVATHQRLAERPEPETVWTWYWALADGDARAARRRLAAMTWRDCAETVLGDLERAHPDVRACARRVDVRRYGHAMPRPVPGFLAAHRPWWDPPADARVFWANSDVSGLSLFEEAQDRGVRAAERALALLGRGA